MYFYFFVFLAIIIYFIMRTIKRRKMNTLEAFILLFVGFLGIVSAVIIEGKDIFPYSSIIILVVSGLACTTVGIIFNHYSKPKKPYTMIPFTHIPEKPSRQQAVVKGIFAAIYSFDLLFAFATPILTWQTVYINGKISLYYITIWDMLMVILFLLGLWLAFMLVRAYRKSRTGKK